MHTGRRSTQAEMFSRTAQAMTESREWSVRLGKSMIAASVRITSSEADRKMCIRDRHGVACFAQQAIGEYEESEKASCRKRMDYKDSTDLILWEYIIRRLTPLECCRLQGFPDNWAEELGITEPTQEDIDHWREVFRTQMEAMGESKKEKTDNQICKWLKDPESDSAKYKMLSLIHISP